MRFNRVFRNSITTPPQITTSSSNQFNNICCINTIKLLLLYYLISMSLYYQVMGAVTCSKPKYKKHIGIKVIPKQSSYKPGERVIFDCLSNETKQTIKCLDDGKWDELPAPCPDPSNNTCPNLEPILHGEFNSTGPFKVGTVVTFRCENEIYNNDPYSNINNKNLTTNRRPKDLKEEPLSQSSDGQKFSTLPITTTINANINEVDAISATTTQKPILSRPLPIGGAGDPFLPITTNQSTTSFTSPVTDPLNTVRYSLSGYRTIRCSPNSKWEHPQPTCTPILPESISKFSLILTSAFLILVPILILIVILQLFVSWRKRQQQRERWKQYFTDYKYRHSKTSITFGMRAQNSNSSTTIPITDL